LHNYFHLKKVLSAEERKELIASFKEQAPPLRSAMREMRIAEFGMRNNKNDPKAKARKERCA
jgi:hypothetical protein